MLTRLRKNLADANYGALALELILVVFGILIAFQIDRWAEERREREQESQAILRLIEDLQIEGRVMGFNIQYAAERLEDVKLLEEISKNPDIARRTPAKVLTALEQVTWRTFPQIDGHVYSELKTTGQLGLIRSDRIRSDLSRYYSYYQHYAGIGTDLQLQDLFTRLTAGILTTAELTIIQGNRAQREEIDVSPERAYEVALALSQVPEAIDLLPSIAQHQVHNQRFVGVNRERGERLIKELREHAGISGDQQ